MKYPLGPGAVSEDRDGDPPGPAQPVGKGTAQGDGYPSPDDSVGSKDADRHVRDMHRSAPAAADPAGPSHDPLEDTGQIGPLRDDVAMAAVRAGERVFRGESGHDACRHRLLADAKVDRSGNLPVG